MAWANRSKTLNLFSWWGMLLMSVLAGLLAGGLVAMFWPSTYGATSTFFVSDPAELLSTMLRSSAAVSGETASSNMKPTQERLAAILASRMMRAKLVKNQQLDQRLGLKDIEAEDALSRMAKIAAIGTEGFSVTVTCRGYTRLRTSISHTLTREEARQLCAALANDYLTELQTYVTKTSVDEASKKREFIEQAQRHVLRQLGRAQGGMAQLQRGYALMDPDSQAALVTDRIRALEAADAEVRAKVDESRSSLAKAQGQLGRVDSMRIASMVEMRNPIIGQVEQKIADLRVDLATQEAQGKTRQNREVVQTLAALQSCEKQLAELKQDVHKEIAHGANPTYEKIVGQVVDLQVTLAGARARAARTASLLGAARGELAQLPPVAREYATFKQDQEVQFTALAALKQSLAVALVQEQQSQRVGEFLVLDEAAAPPDLHRPPVLWSILLTIGAFLAVLGMMGLNRMIFGR